MPEDGGVEKIPGLELELPVDNMGLCLPVALDNDLSYLWLKDPDIDDPVLYPHVLDLNENIACLFVLLAYPLEVVPEEDPVEDRSRARKDNLHEFVS